MSENTPDVQNPFGISNVSNKKQGRNSKSYVTYNDGSVIKYRPEDLPSVMSSERANMLNYKIFQQQNEYNSAESQKARFLAAGINPTYAMSGQGASSSASWEGASTPDTTHKIGAQNTLDILQGVGNGANQLSSAFSNGINSLTQNARNMATLDKLRSEAKGQDLQNFYQSIMNNVADKTQNDMIAQAHSDVLKTDAEIRLSNARAIYQELTNSNYPEEFKNRMAQLVQTTELMKEQGLTYQKQREFMSKQLEIMDLDKQEKEKWLSWYDDFKAAELGVLRSTSTRNYASARNLDSSTAVNNYLVSDLLPSQVGLNNQSKNESKSREWLNRQDFNHRYKYQSQDQWIKFMQLGLQGVNTYINGVNAASNVVGNILPFGRVSSVSNLGFPRSAPMPNYFTRPSWSR